jgi:8-oxo-dGTP pyrophosphatase MutT (NUDIX family)/predicted amidohydrolase
VIPDSRTGADECACVPPSPQHGCVGDLSTPEQRSAALRDAVVVEAEPLVALTHLLRLCRDEHPVLWERMNDPLCRAHVTCVRADLADVLPAPGTTSTLERGLRNAMVAALVPAEDVPVVVVARALAELLDTHFGHTFLSSFAARSPYQPRVGDPVPLDGYDLRRVTDLATTSPPWRLANRLDETRRVRLAGEWAAQFRVVFDYCLADVLAGVVDRDTVVATCHPNRSLEEFSLPRDRQGRSFPVRPRDVARQRVTIDRLVGAAVDAGASVVVLPELSVTEPMAMELEHWVRRPGGPRLLVTGSFHTQAAATDGDPAGVRRRNRALAWVRGSDRPLVHDKHSPADRPVREDIRPQGWPDLRIHVTADGWHLVLAVCRDLLNPHAVHALSEAGANLVLVPAMSETLMAFGGPVAQLVGSEQAMVAVANNPARWSDPGDPVVRTAPHALLGHPGFERQTRSVATAGPGVGVALLQVGSGEVTWLPDDDGSTGPRLGRHATDDGGSEPPPWVEQLSRRADRWVTEWPRSAAVTLRTAAVLVLLTDGSAGPAVLLTERSADLSHYPGQLVFPGGVTEGGDDGPVATALREAREEVGLGPTDIHVIGPLCPLALPDSGFLVTPVLAWSSSAGALEDVNPAEVRTLIRVSMRDWRRAVEEALRSAGPADREPPPCGPMTETVLDLLASMLSQD